ncbi:TPA: hypothetical protein N0F65_007100 [Lagenidium giganteum]|uniref:GOLD domain-containing protein n=1 Tax=Lagenidium giganteum TaxID=4803 RepID=A0AAV2YK69_9STRA|nr:TPA: hypothetical protein N0F65_007100 [Lagenidium giganteum]
MKSQPQRMTMMRLSVVALALVCAVGIAVAAEDATTPTPAPTTVSPAVTPSTLSPEPTTMAAAAVTPAVATDDDDEEPPQEMVKEDAEFDPYHENDAPEEENSPTQAAQPYEPKNRKVELFDFDPSEGLTFFVYPKQKECFYQDAKFTGDEISGAYVVSSADSHIDLEIKNPEGATIYRRFGDAEGQYEVHPSIVGVHELCFINSDSDGKLVTHVTNTLKSQHPVEREHVSILAKYASHLDVRLGELESEQRLQHIRTARNIKIEDSTSKRVAFYGSLECFIYVAICLFQVMYIKSLLENPRPSRSWV